MSDHEVVTGRYASTGKYAFKCKTCGAGRLYSTPQIARAAAQEHVETSRPRQVTRRTAEEKEQHRQSILDSADSAEWRRPPKDARAIDIDALVKSGHLESEVREEWDKQRGHYSSGFFGGAGVVKRKRRYIRKAGGSGAES